MTKKLTANRQNDLFLTVNRQMDSSHWNWDASLGITKQSNEVTSNE